MGRLIHGGIQRSFQAVACLGHPKAMQIENQKQPSTPHQSMNGWSGSHQKVIPSTSTVQHRPDLITLLELQRHPEPDLKSWNQSPWHVVFKLHKIKDNKLNLQPGQLSSLHPLRPSPFGEWRMLILCMGKTLFHQ